MEAYFLIYSGMDKIFAYYTGMQLILVEKLSIIYICPEKSILNPGLKKS